MQAKVNFLQSKNSYFIEVFDGFSKKDDLKKLGFKFYPGTPSIPGLPDSATKAVWALTSLSKDDAKKMVEEFKKIGIEAIRGGIYNSIPYTL